MMNYIWAGLILVSILFAVGGDIHDELVDRYNNDHIYILELESLIDSQSSESPARYRYRDRESGVVFDGAWHVYNENKIELQLVSIKSLPKDWQEHFKQGDVKIKITDFNASEQLAYIQLPPVHWKRLGNMMQAAFDMAQFAASLALGLIGLMALWLGLMKIAEESGLVDRLVKLVRPILKPLFPEVPPDHPAMGAISLNLAANILGLGNAATPMGIKAMQHLQELNQQKDTASNSMCMFLALNTSSVQLLPPVTVIALLGVNAGGLFLSIFLATLCSTIVAIVAAKWYARRQAPVEIL